MQDQAKTNHELIEENALLKHRIKELEQGESERKQREKSLQKKLIDLIAITDNLPFLAWLKDSEGRFIAVNKPFARSCGLPSTNDLVGKTDLDIWPKHLAEAYRADDFEVMRTGEKKTVEEFIADRGVEQWFETYKSPVYDTNGNAIGTIGFSRDITERKQVAMALQRKSDEQTLLLDNTQTLIWYLTNIETHGVVNRAFADFFGKNKEHFENKKMHDILPGKEAEICVAANKDVFEKKIPIHTEEWIINAKGEKRLLAITKIPKLDELGAVDYVVCSAQDITDLKRIEEELRRSEERLKNAQKLAHIGNWEYGVHSGELHWEQENYRIFGLPPETIPSMQAWYDRIHPDDLEFVNKSIADSLNGSPYNIDFRIRRPDGVERTVHAYGEIILNVEGKPERFFGTVQDITERKQAEEALREKEHLLSETQKIAHIGSWTMNLDSMECQWSDESYHIFGVPPECFVLTLESFLGLIHSDDRPAMGKWIQDCMTGNHPPALEFRIIRPDGTIRFLHGQGYLQFAPGRTPLRLVGSVQDITERKCAEDEKRSIEERLQQSEKMESLGKMAGRVAHDLNNVLGVLLGYSELLTERIPAGNPLREYAANILKSSERAAAIVEDLLTLARRGVRVMEVVNFNKIITNLIATPEFDKLVTYHPSVIVKTDLAKDMLNVNGSPVHLEKTILNLVSNAVEAITGSGEVNIKTENRYLDKAINNYQTVMEGEYVVLTVSDTGKGIPSSELKNIFEPFYTKKSMGRSGTGLGLAIVWGTVQDHHGYIDVQSVEGKGTTFTLYFPATREKAEETQKTPMEQYMAHGESVLVVDDVEGQRNVATTLLKQLGYSVNAVSSGEEAVEYLKSNKADILVLDMIMEPGIDGLDTYKQILEINHNQKTVIVSGFSETDRVKEAQKLGAGAYIKKPYLKEKIGVALRDELAKK
ncbi:MAG: PAS domain-containing hybrid sensor histidine kinase/response regulator [Syntrophales bacterium]